MFVIDRFTSEFDFEFDLHQMDSQLSTYSNATSSESSNDDLLTENDFVVETDDLLSFCESLGSPLRSNTEAAQLPQGELFYFLIVCIYVVYKSFEM